MSIVPSGHPAVAKVLVTFLTGSGFLYPDQPARLLRDIVALCVQTNRTPLLQDLKDRGCPNLIREVLTYAAGFDDKDVYYLFLADASTEDVDFVNQYVEGAMGEFERWSLLRVTWIKAVVLQGARGSRAGGGGGRVSGWGRGSGARVDDDVIYILDEDDSDDVVFVEEDENEDTRPSRRRRGEAVVK
jgi:replicative DNA helicase